MVLTANTVAPDVRMSWIGHPDDAHHGILRVSLPESAAAAADDSKKKPATVLNVILDNSMSMGSHARTGVEALVEPLAGSGLFDRGVVTLFDDGARSFVADTAEQVRKLAADMPRQGMTNILGGVTHGMDATTKRVAAAIRDKAHPFAANSPVHVVTVMLTDGAHNTGPRPDPENLRAAHTTFANAMRKAGAAHVLHTVIMFCLTESSDATVSMHVKGAFENADVAGLPNVFFAKTHHEMTGALTSVIAGLRSTVGAAGARFVKVGLRGARVMATDEPVSTVHLSPGGAVEMLVEVTDRDAFGVKIDTEETAPSVNAIAAIPDALAAVQGALDPLARASVAGGSEAKLAARIDAIARVIDVCERLDARSRAAAKHRDPNANADGDLSRLTPAQRRELVRELRTATTTFQTVRNELFALKVKGRSNSDKLSLLTGRQQKFAAVAAGRSKAEGRTAAEVYANTSEVRRKIATFLAQDLEALKANGVDPAALPVSAVSLLSQHECLEQWVEDVEIMHDARDHDDDAIFDILCALGVLAAPVKFANGDCVQVDPMQLKVAALGVETVDTASMMLTFKLGRGVKLADGNEYVDALPLVDPAFPRATSFLIRRSMWGEHLTSAVVSRDLYLYLPQMQLAAHTHAFRKAITDGMFFERPVRGAGFLGVSEAHVRLALRVLYSASRMIRPKASTEAERALLKHWLGDLKTITRSEGDKVDHPALLQLLLAVFAWDAGAPTEEGVPMWSDVDERSALLNLLNEVLARRVSGTAGMAAAQQLLGVTRANSPAAQEDPFIDEPAFDAIRARCAKAPPASFDPASVQTQCRLAALLGGAADADTSSVVAFVESVWAPFVAVHRFTTALLAAQKTRGEPASMRAFFDECERVGSIPDAAVAAVSGELKAQYAREPSVWVTLCVGSSARDTNASALGALLQALVFPTSRVRSELNVAAMDVTDAPTQRELFEALHMAHYKDTVAEKQQRFLAMVGDVVTAQARACDTATLRTMIGVHTHGHCSEKFWAFIEGALLDPCEARREEKLQVIREMSNGNVTRCISRASCTLGRKGRR
uniref:VWFA domain-containing protein n=1 Tax=Neobodo designis TaxID=312471 RepID=A0A7S1L5E2_NEODS|mmetsp:Transcript_15112/g.46856  ORF Transcript_15112/g.46856 Transcript_15112/m.46856 type:complete len:1060 (+) Transcript_15112:100-3279(+)